MTFPIYGKKTMFQTTNQALMVILVSVLVIIRLYRHGVLQRCSFCVTFSGSFSRGPSGAIQTLPNSWVVDCIRISMLYREKKPQKKRYPTIKTHRKCNMGDVKKHIISIKIWISTRKPSMFAFIKQHRWRHRCVPRWIQSTKKVIHGIINPHYWCL